LSLCSAIPASDNATVTRTASTPGAGRDLLLQISLADAGPSAAGDQGTNDLLVSDVIRTNEMQVWFLSEHLVNMPLTHAK